MRFVSIAPHPASCSTTNSRTPGVTAMFNNPPEIPPDLLNSCERTSVHSPFHSPRQQRLPRQRGRHAADLEKALVEIAQREALAQTSAILVAHLQDLRHPHEIADEIAGTREDRK